MLYEWQTFCTQKSSNSLLCLVFNKTCDRADRIWRSTIQQAALWHNFRPTIMLTFLGGKLNHYIRSNEVAFLSFSNTQLKNALSSADNCSVQFFPSTEMTLFGVIKSFFRRNEVIFLSFTDLQLEIMLEVFSFSLIK